MKSTAPWSVKGIERDARETAKEAARKEGMTVGEWLNQTIYNAGEGGQDVDGLKLKDVVTAVEMLSRKVASAEKSSAQAVQDLAQTMGGVVERVQRLERPGTPADTALDERLSRLEEKAEDRQRIDTLKALEKAVAQVALQFNSAHRGAVERLDANEQQLKMLAERIDQGIASRQPADPAALDNLRTAIEGMALRISRAEKIAADAARLKAEASGTADAEFVERTGKRLRVLGDEIKRGGDQIRALETSIDRLSEQIDAAERRSSQGVQKVSETIADLREQLIAEAAGKTAAGPVGLDAETLNAAVQAANARTEERMSALQSSLALILQRLEKQAESAAQAGAAMQPAAGSAADAVADSGALASRGGRKAGSAAADDDLQSEIAEAFAEINLDDDSIDLTDDSWADDAWSGDTDRAAKDARFSEESISDELTSDLETADQTAGIRDAQGTQDAQDTQYAQETMDQAGLDPSDFDLPDSGSLSAGSLGSDYAGTEDEDPFADLLGEPVDDIDSAAQDGARTDGADDDDLLAGFDDFLDEPDADDDTAATSGPASAIDHGARDDDSDDFSFDAPTDGDDSPQAILDSVRAALTAPRASSQTIAKAPAQSEDDLEAALAAFDEFDDEDDAAPAAAAPRPPATSQAAANPKARLAGSGSMAEIFKGDLDEEVAPAFGRRPSPDKGPRADESALAADPASDGAGGDDDDKPTDFIRAARLKAREAAERNAEDDAKREAAVKRVRNLSPRQRALLAEKKRKRLEAEAAARDAAAESMAEKPAGDPAEKRANPAARQLPTADDFVDATGEAAAAKTGPAARFAGLLGRVQRKRDDLKKKAPDADDAFDADAAPRPVTKARKKALSDSDDAGDARRRSALRAAMQEDEEEARGLMKAARSRPITLVLVAAIALTLVALFFMLKDIFFAGTPAAPVNARAPSVIATPTTSQTPASEPASAAPTADSADAGAATDLIEPGNLYIDAMAALNTAITDRQIADAVKGLEQAAALGYPPAQLELGELYKSGRGIGQDLDHARLWYERAANGGNVLAMHRLGVMAARGEGGPVDINQSVEWFEKAGNFGLVDAQYNLGATYHPSSPGNANSVQDREKAYYWYRLAEVNGDDQAGELARDLGQGLTIEARRRIEDEVSAWAPLSMDRAANTRAPVTR